MFTEKQIRESMRLYAVSDRSWLGDRSLESCVAEAIEGGITCLQLREKQTSQAEFEMLAHAIKPLCFAAHIPFLVNDDVELALRVGADGVHIGQDDADCVGARELLGSQAIIGVSVRSLEEASKAVKAGANYLGVGAMFGTPTKPEASEVSIEMLTQISSLVDIPVVAIGGLKEDTIQALSPTGIDGVAVVSAIFGAHDIVKATKDLRSKIDALLA